MTKTEKIINRLLEQAKEIIGDEESIIISYEYHPDFDLFYIITAKPMTNIIWKRRFNVRYGQLKYEGGVLAEFNWQ